MFRIGQRWISEMEPELGLGSVTAVHRRVVTIDFPASGCTRCFAIASAPLRRIRFQPGDTITLRDGTSFRILDAVEAEGLMRYSGEQMGAGEEMLADTIRINTPRDRLINLYIDSNSDYLLRYRTHLARYRYRHSPLRGLIGGRIDLIPHQLYVAATVSSRPHPRVLLSDETGLGKTIEAALILHRLLAIGRIERVLIALPDPLVHQWFIELLRRFNLLFRIFDVEYIESLLASQPGTNVFLEEQLVLCSIDLLTGHPEWAEQAVSAGWDIVVIDEAHHLVDPGPAYDLAGALCAAADGVLLITATPEQLGHASHFSRLRLLDPVKYSDPERFEAEEQAYAGRAALLNKILDGSRLTSREAGRLAELAPSWAAREGSNLVRRLREDAAAREAFIAEVVDRQGTGRAVFRNSRAEMSGFPERRVTMIPLAGGTADRERAAREISGFLDSAAAGVMDYQDDPRLVWLAQHLRQHRRTKVLLICHTAGQAVAVAAALQKLINIRIALFHEQLSLLQRDRQAAWFAEAEGARVLVCSEIGSEGRNFQFCHTLFLFDLPPDPELLEQRIGRLDRIGQTETIDILVPYLEGSGQEVIARWHHEGLNAFASNLPGSWKIHATLGAELAERAVSADLDGLEAFIQRTCALRVEIAAVLQKGQDRLLALNSCRPEAARALQENIATMDESLELDKFMLKLFDLYGILAEEIGRRTFQLNLSLLSQPEFPLPALKREQLVVTFDRRTALSHEAIEFLTWDHPMVIGAIDLLLGHEKGNCAVCLMTDLGEGELLFEALFLLECIRHQRVHPDRFLPPTPIRVVIDQNLQECTAAWPMHSLSTSVRNDPHARLAAADSFKQTLLPGLLDAAQREAEKRRSVLIAAAAGRLHEALQQEIGRLRELAPADDPENAARMAALATEETLLEESVLEARLRLDSLRLIGPAAETI
ncbi:MAG TPA: RNA polymerase-associated protein RapA [bacterium]|nr:RNA polymerase-associated protein RapA [bacterium]HQG44419.1 RNA polymerase-associated protein RapA [bacterium]HQI47719.1 RNA polymerase-associated protein RapA [bacterium]HQJ64080.1 RNA polymerase-associated protein RapA [bacterium]